MPEHKSENEIAVESWSELQERLYEESWKQGLGRFRSNLAFRGMQDARASLRTPLVRLGADYKNVETHLLRNFRKYARPRTVPSDSIWTWLSLGQHHGLPTRLLDWTYSPYVALHFATAETERYNMDGVIWCVDFVATRNLLPPKLRKVLEDEGANVFTVEMLERIACSLGDFDAIAPEAFAAFFEPPSLDDRIVNQYALFSMMSSADAQMDGWLEKHPELWRRFVIPARLKWEVRDKLDQANITERVLFPGLDGLSRWLTRHYTPVRNGVKVEADEKQIGVKERNKRTA